jgi:hypothetical protein
MPSITADYSDEMNSEEEIAQILQDLRDGRSSQRDKSDDL